MDYNLFLHIKVFHNSVQEWLIFLGITLGGILFLRLFKKSVLARLAILASKTETIIDDFLLEMFEKRLYPYFYFLSFYFGTKYLLLPPVGVQGINILSKILLVLILISIVSSAAGFLFRHYFIKESEGGHKKEFSGILSVLNFIIWAFGVLLLLDNLGVKISALVAGMGVGGVAVALAAQAVLKDLFGYFSILFDKPFMTGDFIEFNEFSGTVEHIGIKTTRFRSLSGEQIICSNSDLIDNKIRNYKRMDIRRVSFRIGVTYDIPLSTMKQIPVVLKSVIGSVKDVTFGRAHFAQYGDFSLNYEVVYYVQSPDYDKYMDIQQEINFLIKENFDKIGVRFAYPTRTVIMSKSQS